MRKARFWQGVSLHRRNERERVVPDRLLDGRKAGGAGGDAARGAVSNAQYARVATYSADTALRDIRDLVRRGILVRSEGRGREYELSAGADG